MQHCCNHYIQDQPLHTRRGYFSDKTLKYGFIQVKLR